MKKFFAPLLAAALFLTFCSDDKEKIEIPTDIVIPADIMGMVHGGSNAALIENDINVKNNYETMKEIGIKWILNDFGWGSVQPGDPDIPEATRRDLQNREANAAYWVEGAWDNHVKNANDSGIKILAILDYQAPWLHGVATGEKVTVTDHLGASASLDVYEDGCEGSRCVIGDYEIALFCEYVKKVVSRYDGKHGYGKVDAWRIWNEPNLFPRFWTGSVDQFYKLSVAAAKAVREADPDAVLVVGALNCIADEVWIKKLYSSGAADLADFVSYHPYSTGPLGAESNFKYFLENSKASFRKKVWITEVGHPTNPPAWPQTVSQGKMPQAIVQTVTLLAANGAQKIFWYHLRENVPRGNDNDPENWFGLYENAGGVLTPKGKLPDAYKLCAENIPGKTWRIDGLPGLELHKNVQSHYFEGEDGTNTLVIWNDSRTNSYTFEVNLPDGSNYRLHNPANASVAGVLQSDTYTLSVRDSLSEKILFFTWDAE